MYKISLYSLLILIICFNPILSQNKIDITELYSKFAKKENRIKFERELKTSIDTSLSKPLIKENIKLIHKALNNASLYFIKNDLVEYSIKNIFNNYKTLNNKLLFRTIQTAYNLYPGKFINEVEKIYNETNDSFVYSAAVVYLLNSKGYENIHTDLINKFGVFKNDPVLLMLEYFLNDKKLNTPPLLDLVKHKFGNNKTIVYSFQRKDRNFPGITLIKAPNGKFVRNEDSTIFYIPHLALSANGFPGFLKNGNTAQGIYSIQKYYYSPTEEIGPSPVLLSRIPYEIEPVKFYHGGINKNRWNIDDYKNLLPDSWKEYLPVYESYYAGLSGRRVIVAHGNADDPAFYNDKRFSPFTPTQGCLSSIEVWNDKGRLIKSDQIKLMNAFFSTGELYGYLIVVDINDIKEPVTIEELLPVINQYELNSDTN